MTPEQEKLVLENQRLIHYFAQRYKHRLANGNSYDYEDLVSEGIVALVKAAQGFDITKGLKFSTYAVPYIEGTLKKFLNTKVPMAKHSRVDLDLAMKLLKYGLMESDPEDAAKQLDVSVEKIISAKRAYLNIRCAELDALVGDESETTMMDVLDLREDVNFDQNLIVNDFISMLDEREQLVVQKVFEGKNQNMIAKELGVSQPDISRKFHKILDKARKYGRGESEMSKIKTLRKLIPKEKLQQLLLENKTSAEIGAMFGYKRDDIEYLKSNYNLTKTILGINYHDRDDEEERIMEMKNEEVQPESQSEEAVQSKAVELPIKIDDFGRIVINAQTVTINIYSGQAM